MERTHRMSKDTWRLVTRDTDGELVIHDFDSPAGILRTHLQVGADDCSTDLGLRGAPVFRTLVGPMPEGRNIVRYETPEVFEALTKEWAAPRSPRRRSRKTATLNASAGNVTADPAPAGDAADLAPPQADHGDG
jgi:hypothetical protein